MLLDPKKPMSVKAPKISVVIPAFNAGDYLGETLASVRNQNYPCLEVILVDGGSSDNTRGVVAAFAGLVTQFISEPDRGQLHAVQKGIAASTGEILHWLNADDIMMPGTLAYVAEKFMADSDLDLVYSDNFAFERTRKVLWVGPTIRGLSYDDHLLFYRQMYSECVFWRATKTRLLSEDSYQLRIYTDYAFFLNLRWGLKEMWVPKRLGAFRVRQGQMSQAFAQKKECEFESIRMSAAKERGWSEAELMLRRTAHAISFFRRQVLWPAANSASRKLCRIFTRDKKRKFQTCMFFDRWLGSSMQDERIVEALWR